MGKKPGFRWGSLVSTAGVVLLCVCFFLPQVEGCKEPVVPAEEVAEGHLLAFFLPFLFAFVRLVFGGVRWLVRRRRAERRAIGTVCAVICILVLAGGAAAISMDNIGDMSGSERPAVLWLIVNLDLIILTLLAPVVLILCRPDGRMAAATLLCGLGSLTYFGFWPVDDIDSVYYGLWLSLTASALIVAGSAVEFRQEPKRPRRGPPRRRRGRRGRMIVEQRTLGRTGLSVGVIGLGTEYLIDVPRQTVVDVVNAAVAAGVNYVDMLFAQPHHRDNFGAALRPVREKIVLTGHLGAGCETGQYKRTRDPGECRMWFEDLLTRLGTDHVDVLFVSNCDEQDDYDRVCAPGGMLDLARRLVGEGKARFVAISGHQAPVAEQAARSGAFDVLMHGVNLSGDAEPGRKELYRVCAGEGVAVVAMKPFAGGALLAGGDNGPPPTPIECLAYALAQPAVAMALPGVKDTAELAADLAVLTAVDAERDFSAALGRFQKPAEGQCVYCNHCLPCPAGIDIGRTIRLLDSAGDPPTAAARADCAALPAAPSACVECGDCTGRCPFGVDPEDRIRQAAETFE